MDYTYQGRKIRILSRDSDPTCDVWVVFEDNPDEDAMVPTQDLAHTCPRHGETMPCWECDVEVEIAVQDAQLPAGPGPVHTLIAKLLAKAEGNPNPHEAESFMVKAEELMLKFGIERVLR